MRKTENRPKLAIIGTGIAGMAAAWYARHDYDISVYEKNDYVGGHTNTVNVDEDGRNIPIDTGFMVYNEKTYPNLVNLFKELRVQTMDTSMSFGVQNRVENLEFSCSSFSTFFAQRKNIANPFHWLLLKEIVRYFKVANRFLENEENISLTIGEFLAQHGFSNSFAEKFVLPMAAAIWSTPPQGIREYPAATLLRFMKNHLLLGIGIQLQWKTVQGGSREYRDKIISHLKHRVALNSGVRSVSRQGDKAIVIDALGRSESFDAVVVATHADQALAILENPTALEQGLLGKFRYNTNPVVLHSDASVMPRNRKAWSSWNFRYDKTRSGNATASTHYWMNNLQKVSERRNYFVSVDYQGDIDESKVHWKHVYEHPRFNTAAISVQPSLPKLNREGPVYFCGSYFKYGFHEDALTSALAVAKQLIGKKRTPHEFATV